MEIDLNKLPEQLVISRDVAVNTFVLMQNLKGLVQHLINQGTLPPEVYPQLPATIHLIQAWDQIANTALAAMAKEEATDIFSRAGIRMEG